MRESKIEGLAARTQKAKLKMHKRRAGNPLLDRYRLPSQESADESLRRVAGWLQDDSLQGYSKWGAHVASRSPRQKMCTGKTDRIQGGYDRKAKDGKTCEAGDVGHVGSDRLLLSLLTRAGLRDDRHAVCVFRISQHARLRSRFE